MSGFLRKASCRSVVYVLFEFTYTTSGEIGGLQQHDSVCFSSSSMLVWFKGYARWEMGYGYGICNIVRPT